MEPWSGVTLQGVITSIPKASPPGRHIVKDHLLGYVETFKDPHFNGYADFVVDDHGILRKRDKKRRSRYQPRVRNFDYAGICKWLGNRKITRCGERLAWLLPCGDGKGIHAVWGPRKYGESWT